ncbi:MAG: response regulator [Deltaproteobacteria bacterium]|nr:response regulator [Deltaproteobacteria bacterium]
MEDLKHMLVVDDEKTMRDLLAEYLKGNGYEVTCAANGRDALQIYRQGHFDIVLSDLFMEPMDGLELLSKIKEINPGALFIMITGHPSIQSSIEVMKKGARDYITKPFHIDEIKVKIERALLEQNLQERLKNTRGMVLALIISIPVWLVIGIVLAKVLMS